MDDRAKPTDYVISTADADWLKGVVEMPGEIRRILLERHAREHGAEKLIALFVQFIGLANSVVANNREMVEVILICEGHTHPHSAEQANLPTIFGALSGITLAQGIDATKLCEGCAFRIGTCANQSPVTTSDADWSSHPGEQTFLCHMDGEMGGKHRKACAGFAQLRARRREA